MVQNTEPVLTDFTYGTERDGSQNETSHSCVLQQLVSDATEAKGCPLFIYLC